MSALSLSARVSGLEREALLRFALKLDAVVSGANGVAYLVAAEPLEDLLGVSATVLRPIGVFFVLYAAAVWFVGTRPAIPRPAVLAVIAGNLAWTAGSLAFAALDAASPTAVGTIWIVLQALVVAGFAALQWLGTRPESPSSSAISS